MKYLNILIREETHYFLSLLSALPLQVGSVGVWVHSLFQVVAEVHQHLSHRAAEQLAHHQCVDVF